MKHVIPSILLVFFFGVLCTHATPPSDKPVSHALWDSLLQQHVERDGDVIYKGFIRDSSLLNQYIETVASVYPNKKHWSHDQRLAYWINVYNAHIIRLVIRNYPLKSIKDLNPAITIPYVNRVWDKEIIHIGGRHYSLSELEEKVIRNRFDDPRVHFALTPASVSSPKLRDQAYKASRLNAQLNDQAISFINDLQYNNLDKDHINISKIFYWYQSDFTQGDQTLIGYINQYAHIEVNEDATIEYQEYDWGLNMK